MVEHSPRSDRVRAAWKETAFEGHGRAPGADPQGPAPAAPQASAPEPAWSDEDAHDAAFYALLERISASASQRDGDSSDVTGPLVPSDPDVTATAAILGWLSDYAEASEHSLADAVPRSAIETCAQPPTSEGLPCFTAGTWLMTLRGQTDVADLKTGDFVLTRDAGFQPIRAVSQTTLSKAQLAQMPDGVPILLRAHALGPGRPDRDTRVSPDHRVPLSGLQASLTGAPLGATVPARLLVDNRQICITDGEEVTYVALLLERGDVVYANGMACACLSRRVAPGLSFESVDQTPRTETMTRYLSAHLPGADAPQSTAQGPT